MTDFVEIFHTHVKQNGFINDPLQQSFARQLNRLFVGLSQPVKQSWFTKAKPMKGLYVWGGVGRGKTMMMDLFFDRLPIDEKRRVHFNLFMIDVHNTIKMLREQGKGKDPLKHIAKDIADTVRVLCFDEFQVYDIADAMVLSELFGELFRLGVIVIATSNVVPDDLYKNGLQRSRFLPFIPLVKAHMEVFHMDSPVDYRQQALNDDGVYFIAHDGRMQALFDKMTSPHIGEAMQIDVDGRVLHVQQAFDKIGWFEFPELCEKPRATRDYEAITKHFDYVFINNVPRMGYDRRNEVKRFILLIDTLYDAGVRVIINAEDAPAKLYHGDDHAFEFERTISRLLEMQGEDYFSKSVS